MANQLFKTQKAIKHFSKGDILQREGELHSRIFYVKSGLLRSYTIDKKGKEHIFMFGSEGWIVSDMESQAFKNKTLLHIDALENSEVYVFHPEEFIELDKEVHDLDSMVASLVKRIGVMQRRILSLMSASARERYESFLEIYPELPNRVPQKMIASYLGITPEALSTIRNKISKGH